jgi:uncharacterized protein YceH (UPF0502 family)
MNTTDGSPTVPAPLPWPVLTTDEARVLGALVEKQLTTPEYYPLTLNALLAACNQKNNRDPVMALDETAVVLALDGLREKKLAWQVFLAGNRVAKYRHAVTDVYHVPDACVPLLAELLLRGPQTAAELRLRAERMHAYADVAEVEAHLQGIAGHAEGPFVARLARETGRREPRWAQLLCGPVAAAAVTPAASGEAIPAPTVVAPAVARLDRLEQEVADLKAQVAAMQARFEELAGQLGQ